MRVYMPGPFGESSRPGAYASDAAWRARRDACRPMAEILAMPPVRRKRALATREAAARMAYDPSATPIGRITALRIVLADTLDIPLAKDWAIAHRKREQERMRARDKAGDPKRAEERQRAKDAPRSTERLAAEREARQQRDRGRRPSRAEREVNAREAEASEGALAAQAREAERAAEDERGAWAALHAEAEALREKATRMGVTLPGL